MSCGRTALVAAAVFLVATIATLPKRFNFDQYNEDGYGDDQSTQS